MSTLVDFQIQDRADHGMICPYSKAQLGSTTYDVLLGRFILIERDFGSFATENSWQEIDLRGKKGYLLEPKEVVLASTKETICLPENVEAHFYLNSSSARKQLNHSLSNYIHPSFSGEITLELCNSSRFNGFLLTEGMRIGQLRFSLVTSRPLNSYSETGRYGGQKGPTTARQAMNKP